MEDNAGNGPLKAPFLVSAGLASTLVIAKIEFVLQH
jgi:hypothetical protein